MEEKVIELRSSEVTEILSATPKWILRWGITVFLFILLIGLTLSYFISYPDILSAKVTITSLNPPVTLVAKSSGKLTNLFVENNQVVKKDDLIGVIENTANYKDVLYLEKISYDLIMQLKVKDTLSFLEVKENLSVGDVTPFYLEFLRSLKELNLYTMINPNKKQIILLKKDLSYYTSLLDKYYAQYKINSEQLKLVEIDFNRDSKLMNEAVISAREYENKKREYLGALNSNEQSRISISNALIQKNNIEKSILQLQLQDYNEIVKLKENLTQSIKKLIIEIERWQNLYLIKSPVNGRVSFFNLWIVNQDVSQGDIMFSIIPIKHQVFIGKCILPVSNSGKLSLGQEVNVKLDNYNYYENGILNGYVTNISDVPNNEGYMVDISLPNGMLTSYKKVLSYKEQMTGTAEIITSKLSILDRVFLNFKKLLK